ncbi:MAG: 3-phosphoshikimate 1-carboxyvinyltransferase [Pyrinomonadaceae bacterium]
MKILPARYLRGTVNIPGDKSISHRAVMLASIAVGETRIENFSTAEDCRTTLKCLEQLGVSITKCGNDVIVKGVGKNGLRKPEQPLDCGNSGTTARLLAGILAGQPFDSVLTGDESLSRRPMNRIIEPLTEMGAKIESRDGCLPLHIFGGQNLRGVEHELPIASAQVKSCLLLAGLFAEGKTSVVERTPTRDHTERMLEWFGAGDASLTARDINIPSDVSSAAFFIVASACLSGSDILLPNVGLNSTRTTILNVLQSVGVDVQISMTAEICNERRGSIRVRGRLEQDLIKKRLILDGDIISKIIDEIPILAVLGTQLNFGIEIRDASELRVKETDRISAIAENLRRMNAVVEEFPDGFKVERSDLKGASIDSFGDHRIAMAFAVAGLLAEGETEIQSAECVNISFPGFFETLSSVVDY